MSRRISAQACSSYQSISKKTVKSMFEPNTRTRRWLDSLDEDQWSITSFDSISRVVCFDIFNTIGTPHHLSLTLPDMSSKSWS